MTLAWPHRLPRRALFALALCLVAPAVRADPPKPAPPPPKLRIKNARSINVVLGYKRHEPASAIKPDKGVWNVVMTPDLAGAAAELVDLTPNAARSRWTLEVQADKLVLDARRFVPTHVYQLDVRKEKKLVGSALVYLYPPPNEDNGKVEFKDEETTAKKDKDAGGALTSVPKGDL